MALYVAFANRLRWNGIYAQGRASCFFEQRTGMVKNDVTVTLRHLYLTLWKKSDLMMALLTNKGA